MLVSDAPSQGDRQDGLPGDTRCLSRESQVDQRWCWSREILQLGLPTATEAWG
jgi:hypothetical protein